MSGKQGRRLLGATLRVLLGLVLFLACFYVAALQQLANIRHEAAQAGLIRPE